MIRPLRCLFALIACLSLCHAQEPEILTIEAAETAGISGLRPFWDRPVVLAADGLTEPNGRGNALQAPMAIWAGDLGWHRHLNYWYPEPKNANQARQPGPILFDAVHRRLLVRFPDAAERIAAALAEGKRIERVHLVLPFAGTEKLARGYKEPTSFVGNNWETVTPRWHAVVWALRQAWQADWDTGPTYNAAVNGQAYWAAYGASDPERDRFPTRFGPAEVSSVASEPVDVTAAFTDDAFGKTLAERLRTLSDCGFLVRKLEIYDDAFDTPGYEYSKHTGSRGIFVGTPQLVVTLAKAEPTALTLAPPAVVSSRRGGQPTAVLPDEATYEALRAKYAFAPKPAWPAWQQQRVRELYNLDGRANAFPETYEQFQRWIDDILATQPRRFQGFDASDQLALYYNYREAFPAPIVDHLRLYWESWLQPEMATKDMVHNQFHQIYTPWRPVGTDYFDRTGDWRGNSSFYRESYTRQISTMNFNHTAALGALLGGAFIGSAAAIEDGRYGLEHFPLRLWSWYDGTSQESIDHYYMSHTLTAQKMFADYGPTRFDRMMGESIVLKSIEELAACYHPGLRRFISTSLRTTPFYPLQVQEGVNHIIHTLSPEGALTDLDRLEERELQMRQRPRPVGVEPIIGHDLSPRRVALQTLDGLWAPEWMANVVDRKPLPWEMTMTWRQWGAFVDNPKWKKIYLANHYGVASFDLNSGPTINLMGLWQRSAGKTEHADDLGLLLVRHGFNRTNFLDTFKGGTLGTMGGGLGVLQHRGKLLIAASPHAGLKSHHFDPKKQPIHSIQASVCVFTLQEQPTWSIFIDGQPAGELPIRCRAGQRIVIHDGVAYIGILPLAATDLGRDREVEIRAGGEPVVTQTGANMRETLVIDNFYYRSETPFDMNQADWSAVDLATGGFAIEIADVTQYANLAAFQEHVAKATLTHRWEADAETLHLAWQSGDDLLEMGFKPRGADENDRAPAADFFPYRRVNGDWPYLPEGIERDTPLSQQGRRGKLEKHGAVLRLEPGRMGYLLSEPVSGSIVAANPLPDPTWLELRAADGQTIVADGKVGIARLTWQPAQRRLQVDYAVGEQQTGEDMATALLLGGATGPVEATVNGVVTTITGDPAVIPLLGEVNRDDVLARRAGAEATAAAALGAESRREAVLHYETGEHYLLTVPRPGAWHLLRLWPSGSILRAETPEGLTCGTDGRLALRSMTIDSRRHTIEIDAPAYIQFPTNPPLDFTGKATAMLIQGGDREPVVSLNGEPVPGPLPTVTIDGRQSWVVPLYGAEPAKVLAGLVERYAAAQQQLAR